MPSTMTTSLACSKPPARSSRQAGWSSSSTPDERQCPAQSADCAGNFIASGSGFATLRDYAKLGVLYLQDGMWDGDRLLPRGWADYALAPTHAGSSYAACFRSNADRSFPDLPPDTAWASGASDQRIFILRGHRMVVSVANETDHPMDLAALNRVIATAIAQRW